MGGYASLVYKQKPLFGMDIGSKTIKLVQFDSTGKIPKLLCYGVGNFDQNSIQEGVITNFESISESIHEIFKNNLIGQISTSRVAMTLPINRTFNKVISIPKVKKNELRAAVMAEAEEYIPITQADLYLDYEIIVEHDETYEILVVAAPQKVVDSYITLTELLGLEPAAFDTSITASARVFQRLDEESNIPSVLIDFGTESADISVHDGTVVVTNTILGGGDTFTNKIAHSLNISHDEAHIIKTKYGLSKSKKQSEIITILDDELQKLTRELKKMIRYYEDRALENKKIGQIITIGGGANMPGLTDYLIEALRLPVRTQDPWHKIDFNKLQPPSLSERSIYLTAAGLALIREEDIFA